MNSAKLNKGKSIDLLMDFQIIIVFCYTSLSQNMKSLYKSLNTEGDTYLEYDDLLSRSSIDIKHKNFICDRIKILDKLKDVSDVICSSIIKTQTLMNKCIDNGIDKQIVYNQGNITAVTKDKGYSPKLIAKLKLQKNNIGFMIDDIIREKNKCKQITGILLDYKEWKYHNVSDSINKLINYGIEIDNVYINNTSGNLFSRFQITNLIHGIKDSIKINIIIGSGNYNQYTTALSKLENKGFFGRTNIMECDMSGLKDPILNKPLDKSKIDKEYLLVRDSCSPDRVYIGYLPHEKNDYLEFRINRLDLINESNTILVK